MLITNKNAPLYFHDRVLDKILIRFLPKKLRPNHITAFRFCLIPLVLWFVVQGAWAAAALLFLLAAFTDALDGSMARVRKQITDWGTFYDPAADKLLIGLVVILFVAKEVNIAFAVIIVVIELMILFCALMRRKRRELISANWAGKMKMLFQVIGVSALLIAKWWGLSLLVPFSIGTLTIAIIFAVVSLLTYSL